MVRPRRGAHRRKGNSHGIERWKTPAAEEIGPQIADAAGLTRHVAALWNESAVTAPPNHVAASKLPIGYILSLEGADSIVTIGHLERAYAQGLRAIGPAHYGPGTYAQGTHATGGIGARGRELLAEMQRLGIILDATHLCADSFWEALDAFSGPVWASHNNARALVNDTRQFSDEQIRALVARGAVIGGVLDGWMMIPGWVIHAARPHQRPKIGRRPQARTAEVFDHIDYAFANWPLQHRAACRHRLLRSRLAGRSAASSRRPISTRSRICPVFRNFFQPAATRSLIFPKLWTAIGFVFCKRRGIAVHKSGRLTEPARRRE